MQADFVEDGYESLRDLDYNQYRDIRGINMYLHVNNNFPPLSCILLNSKLNEFESHVIEILL